MPAPARELWVRGPNHTRQLEDKCEALFPPVKQAPDPELRYGEKIAIRAASLLKYDAHLRLGLGLDRDLW